jgi:hypothetical protein
MSAALRHSMNDTAPNDYAANDYAANDYAPDHGYCVPARASAKLLRRMAAADNNAHNRPLPAHTSARSAKCVRPPINAPPTDGPATLTTPHNPTIRPR